MGFEESVGEKDTEADVLACLPACVAIMNVNLEASDPFTEKIPRQSGRRTMVMLWSTAVREASLILYLNKRSKISSP